jgi:pimeloyl-ACP methyl ester carboxylesterase
MDLMVGRFAAQLERPQLVKFAWPAVLLPDLFATRVHLGIAAGYLSAIGWEVYVPDLRILADRSEPSALGRMRFADVLALAQEMLAALDRDAVVLGHGIGGLVALKLAERARVKAAVAFAPLVPGFRSPLFMRAGNLLSLWRRRPLKPPAGRMLFELVADAPPFQRESLIKALVPDAAAIAIELARGEIEFARGASAAPRLIVSGDSDVFAPLDRVERFAAAIGAKFVTLRGRGHWLIGGRAIERAINETQRFLVRTLGQELLLLYPDELTPDKSPEGKDEDEDDS